MIGADVLGLGTVEVTADVSVLAGVEVPGVVVVGVLPPQAATTTPITRSPSINGDRRVFRLKVEGFLAFFRLGVHGLEVK
jgi:hypothetical protein